MRRLALAARDLARKDLLLTAALAAGAVLAYAFAELADDVAEGDTHSFDRAIMAAMRVAGDPGVAAGPSWLVEAARDVTALGSVTVLGLIVLLIAGLMAALRRFGPACMLIAASLGGVGVSQALKAFFSRDRPELAWRLVEAHNPSFPSGHAMLSAVIYLTLAALIAHFAARRRIKVFAWVAGLSLTVLVGASRVYLGVHWTTDVLAGWALGAAWAMLWLAIARLAALRPQRI